MTSFSARVFWKLILTHEVRRKIHHVKPQLYTHANFLFSLTDYVAFVQAAVSALLFKNLKEKLLFLSYLTLIIKCCSIPWQSKSFMQHFIAACRVWQEDLEGKKYNLLSVFKTETAKFLQPQTVYGKYIFFLCKKKKSLRKISFQNIFLPWWVYHGPWVSFLLKNNFIYLFLLSLLTSCLIWASNDNKSKPHTQFYLCDFFL